MNNPIKNFLGLSRIQFNISDNTTNIQNNIPPIRAITIRPTQNQIIALTNHIIKPII